MTETKQVKLIIPFMTGFGGTEKVISNLISAYNEAPNRKINFQVISYGGFDDGDWLKQANFKIVKMARSDFIRRIQYLLLLPWMLLKFVFTTDAQVVISTNPVMWSLIYLWSKILRKKVQVVSWYHYSLKKKPVNSVLLSMADNYLAISSGVRDELVELGIKNQKIHLIFNPIPRNTNLVARPSDTVEIVYVGRLMMHGQKNLSELFSALSKIDSSNWHLSIFGDGFDRDVREVKAYVSEKKLSDKIRFYGFVENPWKKMEQATVLVLTSLYEGFGMVLAEALSHGIYVISSDCETGPRDIINSFNGKLYSVGDVQQLSSNLNDIIDNSNRLPEQDALVQSVTKFYQDTYYDKFEKAVLEK